MDIRATNTKFFLVINTVKIGTQYVKAFNQHESGTPNQDNIFNLELIKKPDDFVWNLRPPNSAHENDSNYKALDSFLNGTIKKDVIILIRDPFERFISAFNQDFIKPIFHDVYNLQSIGLSILKSDGNQSLYDWWLTNNLAYLDTIPDLKTSNDFSYDDLDKTFKLCIESIIKSVIISWAESKCDVNYNHNIYYHPIIVNMVFENKNKFKIFDIDDVDMNDIFCKYLAGIQSIGSPNASNFIKRIISDIFNNNDMLNSYVKKRLKREYMAYGSLKKLAQLKNN